MKSSVSTGALNDNNVQPGSGFRGMTGRGRGVRGKTILMIIIMTIRMIIMIMMVLIILIRIVMVIKMMIII